MPINFFSRKVCSSHIKVGPSELSRSTLDRKVRQQSNRYRNRGSTSKLSTQGNRQYVTGLWNRLCKKAPTCTLQPVNNQRRPLIRTQGHDLHLGGPNVPKFTQTKVVRALF